MAHEFLNKAAELFEQDNPPAQAGDDSESYAAPVWKAADSLAVALELFRNDPAYAESLGITKRGMDYLHGAESVLNAAAINHDL